MPSKLDSTEHIESLETIYRVVKDKFSGLVKGEPTLVMKELQEEIMKNLKNKTGKKFELDSELKTEYVLVRFKMNRPKNTIVLLFGSKTTEDIEPESFRKHGKNHVQKTYEKMKVVVSYEINNFKISDKEKFADVQKFYELYFQNENSGTSWKRECEFTDYWREKEPNKNKIETFIPIYQVLLDE